MLAFVAAIFVSSLLGSAHCVGMCGPMALWASGVGGQGLSRREQTLRLCGYHFGRLLTYLFAGAVAGLVGGMVTLGGDWLGWQQTAARLTGSVMVGLGVWKLLQWWQPADQPWGPDGNAGPSPRGGSDLPPRRSSGFLAAVFTRFSLLPSLWEGRSLLRGGTARRLPGRALPSLRLDPPAEPGGWQQRLTMAISRRIAGLRPAIGRLPVRLRSVAIGAITTWLPCGWLYLFVLVAAATAGVLPAMAVMFAFWLGTLPALSALVAGTVSASPRFRPAMRPLIAGTLIVAGIYTSSGRAATDLMPLGEAARRHSAAVFADAGDAAEIESEETTLVSQRLWQLLGGLSSEPLPCCDPEPSAVAGGP